MPFSYRVIIRLLIPQCIGYFLLGQLPLLPFSLEFLSKRHFGNHSCSQKVCDIKLRKSIDKGT